MELELGLRITRTGEESTSTDLRIVKDRAGPVFFSRETEKMFILTVHLKGFNRERIKVEINEDGARIAISGEKPVQEMVMVRWIMYKKEKTVIEFRKVFRIPDGVVLDRIKAKFNEEDSILTIFMPKSVKGFLGIEIEEVKEEEVDGEKSEPTPVETVAVTETNLKQESPQPESEQPLIETKQERNPIEETSSGTPEIGIENESEERIPTEIPESTATETSQQETEIITEPAELESKPPDSIPFEEIQQEATLELQEQISKQRLPEPEIKIPEQEPEEKPDLGPETAEHAKEEPGQAVEPPETPEEGTKQEITHDNLLKEEIKEEETQKNEEPPVALRTSDQHQEISEGPPVALNTSDQHQESSEEPMMKLEAETSEVPEEEHLQNEEIQEEDMEGQREGIEEVEPEIREADKATDGSKSIEAAERMDDEEEQDPEKAPSRSSSGFCGPCIFAGSALIGFLIVLVIQLLKKRKIKKKH